MIFLVKQCQEGAFFLTGKLFIRMWQPGVKGCLQVPTGLGDSNPRRFDLVMGTGFDPDQVMWRVIFLLLGSSRVSHLWLWEISAKNPKIFNFFPLGQKNTQIKMASTPFLL